MANVELGLIAIPAGVEPTGELRVSIVVSPRLRGARRLGAFPDMLAWTANVAVGVNIELKFRDRVVPATLDTTALEPAQWKALFNEGTPVEPYTFDDYSDRLVVSYQTRTALEGIRNEYARTSLESPDAPPSAVQTARNLDLFAMPAREKGDVERALAERRLERFQQQVARMIGGQASLQDIARDFTLYHRMPIPSEKAPDPLPTRDEIAESFDFHKGLTALANYPSLQRALGLVLDVRVPRDGIGPSNAFGFPVAQLSVERFEFDNGFEGEVELLRNPVLYEFRPAILAPPPGGGGLPALRTREVFTAVDPPGGPQPIVQGFLGLDPSRFQILDVDIDGAMAKLIHTATMLPESRGTVNGALPALRSAGLALAAHNRGGELVRDLQRASKIDAGMRGDPAVPAVPLGATDLVRGYRFDVWSSHSVRWQSLHQRDATYRLGEDGTVEFQTTEEGFTQLAVVSPAPDLTRAPPLDGTPPVEKDLYLHERLARWTGWSLSAPRPGHALNRSSDAHKALDDDPSSDETVTAIGLRAAYTPVKGSLPSLRFGRSYRFRARVVDLAGNSPEYSATEIGPTGAPTFPVSLPSGPESAPYLRYEPVPHPIVVLRKLPAGKLAAVDRLVIRSFNNNETLDTIVTAEQDERHIAPPRSSAEMAERHGALDDSSGKLRSDAATFAMLVARHDAKLATVPMGEPPSEVPIEAGKSLQVDYLPDPIARAAALKFVPGLPAGNVWRAGTSGVVKDPEDPEKRAGPVVQVQFGQQWPTLRSFRLQLAEGSAEPQWEPLDRVLTISLPKSGTAIVPLSSAVSQADLLTLGVWAWQRQQLENIAATRIQTGGEQLARMLEGHARLAEHVIRLALEGGQWALTPALPLKLVHAVQQPLGRPEFTCCGGPAAPPAERPAGLEPSRLLDTREPLTAWRRKNSSDVALVGALQTHYASTGRVDIRASWTDIVDDADDGIREVPQQASVEPILLGGPPAGEIPAQGKDTRYVGLVQTPEGLLTFKASHPVGGVFQPVAPLHRFEDTRHRMVTYRAVSTSRFVEDFPQDQSLVFTRTSEPVTVDVPSSAAPLPPDVRSVLPTFGWRREHGGSVTTSIRLGRGIRIYLGREWFSSGAGELLGVVLWRRGAAAPSDIERRDRYRRTITQWGLDPVRAGGRMRAMPALQDFPDALATAEGLRIAEDDGVRVDVAGHRVAFDKERKLWYVDVTLEANDSYMPFVRLALARFQPHSLQGVELSSLAIADFMQIAPDRSAVLIMEPDAPTVWRVIVSGFASVASASIPWRSYIDVSVQQRDPGVASDLGWVTAPASVARVTQVDPPPNSPAVLFSGLIEFASVPTAGTLRVALREYEFWEIDPPEPLIVPAPPGGLQIDVLSPASLFASPVLSATSVSPLRASAVSVQLVQGDRMISQAERAGAFALTDRFIDRIGFGVLGPHVGSRIVYAEFIPVDPPATAKDPTDSIGMAQPPDGVGGPGGPGEEPVDETPLPPPFAGPAVTTAPDWSTVPPLAPAAGNVISGFVKLAQAMLNSTGVVAAPLAIDGQFGLVTQAVLDAFKSTALLAPGLGLDTQAWTALALAAPFPTLEPGLGAPPMRGPPVTFVQRALNVANGAPLLVDDGVYGPITQGAVRNFQSERGLPDTGVVDFPTWTALTAVVENSEPSGAERVTMTFDRDRTDGGGNLFVVEERVALEDTPTPTSDPCDQDWSNSTGFWFEMRDAAGGVLFRRVLEPAPNVPREVPPDPDGGELIGHLGDGPRQARLSVILPVIANARSLLVFGNLDDEAGAAIELERFEPWQT